MESEHTLKIGCLVKRYGWVNLLRDSVLNCVKLARFRYLRLWRHLISELVFQKWANFPQEVDVAAIGPKMDTQKHYRWDISKYGYLAITGLSNNVLI